MTPSSHASREFIRYTLALVGVVVVVGTLFSFAFRGPGDRVAIVLSGAVAIVVQLAAARLGQIAGRGNLMARMGTGALLRLFSLVAYALIVVLILKLPAVAAIVSLATFYFLTALIEPVLIK